MLSCYIVIPIYTCSKQVSQGINNLNKVRQLQGVVGGFQNKLCLRMPGHGDKSSYPLDLFTSTWDHRDVKSVEIH